MGRLKAKGHGMRPGPLQQINQHGIYKVIPRLTPEGDSRDLFDNSRKKGLKPFS